jgi:hypothetical protein
MREKASVANHAAGEAHQDRGEGGGTLAYVIFQMAEVAIPRRLFRAILERIQRLWLPEALPR